jgi:hypothetical protein
VKLAGRVGDGWPVAAEASVKEDQPPATPNCLNSKPEVPR